VVSISAQGVDLNGTLPADIHHLSKLRFLDLRRNRIIGPLPQAPFPKLKTLLVDRNGFTSVPPNILVIMPMLATLSLNDNVELQEWELPAAQSPHSQLRVFEASNASVAGTLSLFLRNGSAHPNLVRLLLANNRLAGPVMFASTMLRYLDLSHPQHAHRHDRVRHRPS
jgi:Leucine-rich repeat (LRR) protein